jgi:hypothetical protein
VSAAVPSAELTSAFGEHEAWQWRAHLGQLCDPLAAAELYALEHDADGTIRLADRQLVVPVCLYIAVDDSGACLYIGQCRRRVGGVVIRITGHHAIPPHATGLWLLPVRADCPPAALDRVEARMIRAYTPPYNTAHCPPDRREQRPADQAASGTAHQSMVRR